MQDLDTIGAVTVPLSSDRAVEDEETRRQKVWNIHVTKVLSAFVREAKALDSENQTGMLSEVDDVLGKNSAPIVDDYEIVGPKYSAVRHRISVCLQFSIGWNEFEEKLHKMLRFHLSEVLNAIGANI